MRLVLIHGWALDATFWQKSKFLDIFAKNILFDEIIYAHPYDGAKSYFDYHIDGFMMNMKDVIIQKKIDENTIVVGHSLAGLKILERKWYQNAKAVCFFNSFEIFCNIGEMGWGIASTIVRRMIKEFDRDPVATIHKFLTDFNYLSQLTRKQEQWLFTIQENKIGYDNLIQGLFALKNIDARERFKTMLTENPDMLVFDLQTQGDTLIHRKFQEHKLDGALKLKSDGDHFVMKNNFFEHLLYDFFYDITELKKMTLETEKNSIKIVK